MLARTARCSLLPSLHNGQLQIGWGGVSKEKTGGPRTRFPAEIKCQKCGQTGSAIWEEATQPNPDGPKPVLISLPDGFYHRVRRDHDAPPDIVCGACGAIVRD
jgi:hypothetical protein